MIIPMTDVDIIYQLAEMGITASSLVKVGTTAFGLVLAAYFLGWKIGLAISLIKKI